MAKEWAIKYYKSTAWQRARESYILTVHGLCERCLDTNMCNAGYIVHHKIWLTPENIDDVDIFLNAKNLEYLCIFCHNKEHMGSKEEIISEDLEFDMYGDIIKKEY